MTARRSSSLRSCAGVSVSPSIPRCAQYHQSTANAVASSEMFSAYAVTAMAVSP